MGRAVDAHAVYLAMGPANARASCASDGTANPDILVALRPETRHPPPAYGAIGITSPVQLAVFSVRALVAVSCVAESNVNRAIMFSGRPLPAAPMPPEVPPSDWPPDTMIERVRST